MDRRKRLQIKRYVTWIEKTAAYIIAIGTLYGAYKFFDNVNATVGAVESLTKTVDSLVVHSQGLTDEIRAVKTEAISTKEEVRILRKNYVRHITEAENFNKGLLKFIEGLTVEVNKSESWVAPQSLSPQSEPAHSFNSQRIKR